MEKKILVDTDGVLRDFVGGCKKKYGKEFDFAKSNSIAKILGMTQEEFVSDLNNPDFWAELELTKEAKGILKIIDRYYAAKNVYIISSSYQTPNIIYGCACWYKKYMPRSYENKKIIFTNEKYLLANKFTILLDDHEETCRNFSQHGGWPILMPRPWNNLHRVVFPVDRVEDELKMILNLREVVDG